MMADTGKEAILSGVCFFNSPYSYGLSFIITFDSQQPLFCPVTPDEHDDSGQNEDECCNTGYSGHDSPHNRNTVDQADHTCILLQGLTAYNFIEGPA